MSPLLLKVNYISSANGVGEVNSPWVHGMRKVSSSDLNQLVSLLFGTKLGTFFAVQQCKPVDWPSYQTMMFQNAPAQNFHLCTKKVSLLRVSTRKCLADGLQSGIFS